MDYYSDIGKMIKELRVKKNISRKELCAGICSVSFLSRIENGNRIPNVVILKQLSSKLGITSELLFRMIESRGSKMVYEYVSQVQTDLELHRYAKIYDETSGLLAFDYSSPYDRQIILALHYISEYCIRLDEERALFNLQETLNMTYEKGTILSFTEIALLTEIVLIRIRLGHHEEALEIRKSIEANSSYYMHNGMAVTKIKMDIASVILHYINDEFTLALELTEDLIGFIKDKAFHGFLIEAFYLQSLIFSALDRQPLAEKCLCKMNTLKELISIDMENDYIFITDIALNRTTHEETQ